MYSWAFAAGSPQFVAPFVASRKDLKVAGASGVVGAIAGTTYDLELTTNLLVRCARGLGWVREPGNTIIPAPSLPPSHVRRCGRTHCRIARTTHGLEQTTNSLVRDASAAD